MKFLDFYRFFVCLAVVSIFSTSGNAQPTRKPDIVVVPLSEQKAKLGAGGSLGNSTDVSVNNSSNPQEDLTLLKEAQSSEMSAGPREPLTAAQEKELRDFPIEWKEPENPAKNEYEKTNSAPVAPRSIQQTLEEAYMQNADLDAARAGLRANVEQLSQANADWRPSLSVVGRQGEEWHDSIGGPPSGQPPRWNEYHTEYTVQATQNVFKGGQTVAKI